MEHAFTSREACIRSLSEAVASAGGEAVDATRLVVLADSCEQDSAPPPAGAFGLRLRRWIIRDDDLDLFSTAKDTVLSLAAANFVFGNMTVASATSIGLAVLQLAFNAYRRGAVVSRAQAQLLAAMAAFSRPITRDALFAYLTAADSGLWTTEEMVDRELRTLTGIVTASGPIAAVAQTPDGHWVLAGI
jgi:hypothetical protein